MMAQVRVWDGPGFELIGTDSSYFLTFEQQPKITPESLPLQCGETLYPGDDFHMAGRSASAVCPGLHLRDGALIYLGQCKPEQGPLPEDSTMLLFDWINGVGIRPLPDIARLRNRAIAYVAFTLTEFGEWHFTSYACSARIVITNELRRGPAPDAGIDQEYQHLLL